MPCGHCSMSFVEAVKLNKSEILTFYLDHCIYSRTRKCRLCDNTLVLNEYEGEKWDFRCNKGRVIHKKKKRRCAFVISAKHGTLFYNCKYSIFTFFNFVAAVLSIPQPRGKFIDDNFKFSINTKVELYRLIRGVFNHHVCENKDKLGGEGSLVELYEARFGKTNKLRGMKIKVDWAYGGIDLKTKKTFLIPVEKRGKETLLKIIQEKIEPNSTIISECWRDHNCHKDESFVQETVKLSKVFMDLRNYAHKKTMFRRWRYVEDIFSPREWRKEHDLGHVAEYLFKTKYPNLNDRIHYFWTSAASLYPPEQ